MNDSQHILKLKEEKLGGNLVQEEGSLKNILITCLKLSKTVGSSRRVKNAKIFKNSNGRSGVIKPFRNCLE